MSHSPDEVPEDATIKDLSAEYVQSVVRLNKMLDRGVSWSGNEKNCVFLNTRGQRFANVSAVTGLDFADDGRGLGLVDWDHDGDLDAWTVNRTAPMVRFVRNELPPGKKFVAVRLEGVECNRDAINARVEVQLDGTPTGTLVRTLRGGEGFLGQSSKWLHFGLGDRDRFERLLVHWPGGESEEFSGAEVDGRFVLRQGAGRAVPWAPPRPPIRVEPKSYELPRPAGSSRTILTSRVPLPPMRMERFDGQTVALTDAGGGPRLINLWASWCRPCLVELRELSERADEVRAAGLRVFAASVDGLGDQRGSDPAELPALLDRLGFTFVGGRANAELAGAIELTQNFVFGPDRSLPVPISLLVDADGQLVAIYRGPVSVDQLLADVAVLPLEGQARYEAGLPFDGQWVASPPVLRPTGLATELATADYDETAIAYVKARPDAFRRDPGFAGFAEELGRKLFAQGDYGLARQHLEAALRLAPSSGELLAQLGDLLYRDKNWAAAQRALTAALQRDPANVTANFQLGNLANRRGDAAAAGRFYEAAIESDPELADAHLQLAGVRFRQRQMDPAIASLERYVALRPDDLNGLSNLGGALAVRGRFERAELMLRRALKIAPDNPAVLNNLAKVLEDQGRGDEAAALRGSR